MERFGYRPRVDASHPLDNPIWNSLVTRHAYIALGCGNVRRYPPDVAPFAAISRIDEASERDAAAFFESGQSAGFLNISPRLGDDWRLEKEFVAVQMVWTQPPVERDVDPEIMPLGENDIEAMLELKDLVYPAYFRRGTIGLGDYFGIKYDGHLAAMAGIRMAMDGYQEISAVCVHPDWRGKGFANRLCLHLIEHIQRQGDTPFLHTEEENVAARGLYEKLGFVLDRMLRFRLLTRT